MSDVSLDLRDSRTSNGRCACPLCGQDWLPRAGLVLIDRRVFWNGTYIPIQPKEARIFELLYLNRGRVIRSREIFDTLYGHDPNGGPNDHVVKVYISRLRRTLMVSRIPLGIRRSDDGYTLVEHPKR